jgi:branched-subunit amino acid transport protein
MTDLAPAAIWLTLLLAGVLTFLIRLSFIALLGRYEPPPLLRRALRFVPPAVLSAIIFPELLIADGQIALGWDNYRLLAGIVAILVAWRTRSALLTIAVGMAALWLLQLLG